MFVRDFIHVDRPFDVVAPRFVGSELSVEAFARDAISDACTSLGDEQARVIVDGLRCSRGRLRSRGEAIVVPLRFVNEAHAAGPASLEGELEIAPVGAQTELGFEASYRRSADDAVLPSDTRRVTELAVRGFLQALGRRLEH
jgi:hypothetical protein